MPSPIDTPLSSIPLVKKPMLGKFRHLGIETLHDLLFHFPTRYEDFSKTLPIADAAPGMSTTFEGTLTQFSVKRSFRKHMLLTEGTLTDESGSIRLIWFNQKFVGQVLANGMRIRVSGKVSTDREGMILQSPAFERSAREATHTGRLVPVYPETYGITSKYLRYVIATQLQKLKHLDDPVPADLLARLHLPSLLSALISIHFPKSLEAAEIAKKRFAFDEMFFLQLVSLSTKSLSQTMSAPPLPRDESKKRAFLSTLPFSLTGAQERAITEISADLEKPTPMNRLLNGDVGSGKTLVAAAAMLQASARSGQSALLAPTEVLARQHFETLSALFSPLQVHVSLLTRNYHILHGETVSRPTLLKSIEKGIPDIVVGTHAILEESVVFRNLALVVVDEQHRFGVEQRQRLLSSHRTASGKETTTPLPHFLTMTATPIPRTLALAFFGNLELSILDEMPKNRKPIITKIATTEESRAKLYIFIRQEIKKGRQAFVIFPLVETSLALKDVKAAVAEHEKLESSIFPDLSIGLLHGRLKAAEKETIMRDFQNRKYDILVSTSVVEVGIDVPNATIMVIEEAERFGLSQLHQFRGRVGRGEHQSYCFLIPGQNAATDNKRLSALEKTNDGFVIAEEDLKLRGPGSFLGTRQSGIPDIAMENLANTKLVKIARDEAEALLDADPHLDRHALLLTALDHFVSHLHLE